MQKQFYFILLLGTVFCNSYGQFADTTYKKNIGKFLNNGKLFGYVFTGFYYGFNDNSKPRTAFEAKAVLLGYNYQVTDKIKAIIVTDISKAATVIVTDSAGKPLYVKNYEDTKYLFCLKEAEINWEITEFLEVNLGCLILDQFITLQDGFWGHRYVDITFQEQNLYGIPSDLGAKVKFRFGKYVEYDFSVLNGEGVKRYQDIDGKFLYANNLLIFPVKNMILKAYFDYEAAAKPSETDRYTVSGFAGYKNNRVMIGAEYARIFNFGHYANNPFSGASFYGAFSFFRKFEVFARCDWMMEPIEKFFIIGGMQYQPVKNLKLSVNYRHTTHDNYQKIYLNAGFFL